MDKTKIPPLSKRPFPITTKGVDISQIFEIAAKHTLEQSPLRKEARKVFKETYLLLLEFAQEAHLAQE